MKFLLLSDRPAAISTVARWYHAQWAHQEGVAVEQVELQLQKFLNTDGHAPLAVLAYDGQEPVGAAQLKIREMPIYPEFEHWLGGVYVRPDYRGRGIGSGLVGDIQMKARAAGVATLYLQTKRLDGGLYCRHGFEKLQEAYYRGYHVTVMKCDLQIGKNS